VQAVLIARQAGVVVVVVAWVVVVVGWVVSVVGWVVVVVDVERLVVVEVVGRR
jgi:hypothetical protein